MNVESVPGLLGHAPKTRLERVRTLFHLQFVKLISKDHDLRDYLMKERIIQNKSSFGCETTPL